MIVICWHTGMLTKWVLEDSIYEEMIKKIQELQTLKAGKTDRYKPKLTATASRSPKPKVRLKNCWT